MALILWILSGLVGGYWLGLILGGRLVMMVFGLVLGLGCALIAASWIFYWEGREIHHSAPRPGKNAREWLDEFLVEQQKK